ncbi:MAG: flagellar biosynthesis/type III secretory pathway chaperone [Desulforhopalus sp.]|jgi:flagellar biosynthesis/type III secretory pathway chaperone
MSTKTTHDYLVQMHELILQERECAINLNIDGMAEAVRAKGELMKILAHIQNVDESDKEITKQIRYENRRNAFLFKSTLGWIRNTMEFFGQRTVTSTYGAQANTVTSQVNGRLLSGRV